MKFSIIIPLYNKELYINKTINSVLNQTYQNFEIIIVDDGSTDNSLFIAKSILDPRIIITEQENAGVSVARNTGIKHSSGDYLVFLDADDIYLPNALEHFNNLINIYPNNNFFCTNYYRVDKNSRKKAINVDKILGYDYTHSVINNFFYIAAFHPGSFPCCVSTFCIKREALLEKNIFFPSGITHTEDIYFCSLLAINFQTVFSRECIYEYYINNIGNSRNTRPTNERYIITELKKIVGKDKWIKFFITKNIIHLIYNCLELGSYQDYKKHKADPYFKYKNTIGSYKLHFLILKFLPYPLAKILYSYKKK
ncbi:glycosyltransferase family 2 protein [Proteus sp. FME41]|uniref:glycosyltransferase family 2 protein n=1 Tax=Proteus sp. FME41 TaxID=2742608 RepID=UPI0018660FF1|nr:glycosyltransferase family 2 protein [Proteus sp. FME41]